MEAVDDDNEGIRRINNTDYGPIAGIYTESKEIAERYAREVNAGTILVNANWGWDGNMPMSGRKLSGRNTVYSKYGFRHFVKTKAIQYKFTL